MALDASIALGAETAYGTAASTVDGYEGKGDSWKTTREFVESVGFRTGLQTARADRRRIVDMGGEGEIECDVLDAGAATLFAAALDRHDAKPSGKATVHTYTSANTASGTSFTAEMVRPKASGGLVAFRHVGCVATTVEFTQEVGNPLSVKTGFDFQTVTHGAAPLAPVYPAAAFPYDWTTGVVEIKRPGAAAYTPLDVTKWSISTETGVKTDRRFVRGNPLKKLPVRAAVPTYEGSIEAEFDDATLPLYEDFIAGAVLSLRISYTGATKASDGKVSGLVIEAPAIQFTGDSPEASIDEVTTIELPFRILDPGTADALKLVYTEPTPAAPAPPAGN
ncbi:phage tail tube protein [Amycolatopsis sp. NPDC059021]|uniref:phage tail tube protein n=1 Tax=Amycolatopsis sp. NPDC059021 TaxID=3346704 RepID=UPI003671FF53